VGELGKTGPSRPTAPGRADPRRGASPVPTHDTGWQTNSRGRLRTERVAPYGRAACQARQDVPRSRLFLTADGRSLVSAQSGAPRHCNNLCSGTMSGLDGYGTPGPLASGHRPGRENRRVAETPGTTDRCQSPPHPLYRKCFPWPPRSRPSCTSLVLSARRRRGTWAQLEVDRVSAARHRISA